jgi:hypothetical protein
LADPEGLGVTAQARVEVLYSAFGSRAAADGSTGAPSIALDLAADDVLVLRVR